MSTRSSVLCKERFKQRSEVMNPNMRIHENLVTERHQESQHEKTQHILTLNQQCSEMGNTELAAHCLTELNNFRRGEPGIETYGVELLRRATVQGDQEAWGWTQQCLGQLVLGWLGRHPNREAACRLESAENYVAQAFERFCPQEFSDVRDIYRLRNNIMHRLLRNADQLRWRLS